MNQSTPIFDVDKKKATFPLLLSLNFLLTQPSQNLGDENDHVSDDGPDIEDVQGQAWINKWMNGWESNSNSMLLLKPTPNLNIRCQSCAPWLSIFWLMMSGMMNNKVKELKNK